MHLVVDEIEGPYYIDIVLTPDEVERMKLGEMIDLNTCVNGKRFYVGARMMGKYEKEDAFSSEED